MRPTRAVGAGRMGHQAPASPEGPSTRALGAWREDLKRRKCLAMLSTHTTKTPQASDFRFGRLPLLAIPGVTADAQQD